MNDGTDVETEENKDSTNGNCPEQPQRSDHRDLENSLVSVLQQLEDDTLLSFRFVVTIASYIYANEMALVGTWVYVYRPHCLAKTEF